MPSLPAVVLPLKLRPARSSHSTAAYVLGSGRKIVVEDEFFDPGPFSDPSDFADIGVKRGHPLQAGSGQAVPLEVAEVGNLVDEDVGAPGEGDEVVVGGGVAGEHDRTVRGVETVGQSRDRPAVRHGDRGDPNGAIFEDDDRVLGGTFSRCGDGDVEIRGRACRRRA